MLCSGGAVSSTRSAKVTQPGRLQFLYQELYVSIFFITQGSRKTLAILKATLTLYFSQDRMLYFRAKRPEFSTGSNPVCMTTGKSHLTGALVTSPIKWQQSYLLQSS